jgi:hypothetical protein
MEFPLISAASSRFVSVHRNIKNEKSCSLRTVEMRPYCNMHQGALTFSTPDFGPSHISTRTFRSMDTGSQKRFVLVTNVPQSGPTVPLPQNRSLGPWKSWTNCSSISLGPTVIMASLTLWDIVLNKSKKFLIFLPKPLHRCHTLLTKLMLLVISQETYEIDKKFKKFLTPNSISCTLLKTDQSRS